jgi:integrase
MTIAIRQRKPKGGIIQLYLDIYNPNEKKNRTNKALDLFLYEHPTPTQKKSNKETMDVAEKIRSKFTLELAYNNNGLSDLNPKEKDSIDFISYFLVQTKNRYESKNNYGNWDSVHKHLQNFCPKGIPINQVNTKWLTDFKIYLQHKAKKKSNEPLSQSTLHSYFNKVKACLNQAHRDDLILKNPAQTVKGFKEGEVQREYLTFEELQRVVQVDCAIPNMKRAFIFSCLTGIRWSDITNLTWGDLQHSEADDYWFIRFRQQKTKGVETLPIQLQARNLLGEIGKKDELIFKGLKYSAWHNVKLQQWVMKAGISKTITFHCARHTFATLQMTNGTDIYTVSKLLGHRELKTTQLYAKIIDHKKIEASNAIPALKL